MQQQDVALLRVECRERPRDPRHQCGCDDADIGGVVVGRPGAAGRQPRVKLLQLLLVPPVPAQHVGRDTEEPGPHRPASWVIRAPSPVRGGKGLGRQVLGQAGADTAGNKPVDGGEVLTERVLEVGRRRDRTRSQFLVHA